MSRRERVTQVVDADTFKTASRKNPVRLANVDAPAKGERGVVAATAALRKLVQGKEVLIKTVARDSYRRGGKRGYVANVSVGGRSVNAAMRRRLGKR